MRIKRTGDAIIELTPYEIQQIVRQLDKLDFDDGNSPELHQLWNSLKF